MPNVTQPIQKSYGHIKRRAVARDKSATCKLVAKTPPNGDVHLCTAIICAIKLNDRSTSRNVLRLLLFIHLKEKNLHRKMHKLNDARTYACTQCVLRVVNVNREYLRHHSLVGRVVWHVCV